jgi:hypothetical protein
MGTTPLHIACSKSHFEMTKLLLRCEADCTIKDKSSKYAFDLITNHEERIALQRQQCWRRRYDMILLQREVSDSSATAPRHKGSSAQVIKVLRIVDVFRHIVQFL